MGVRPQPERALAVLRASYGTAEQSLAAYQHACAALQHAQEALPTDRRVAMYAAALHGISALYQPAPLEQFTRVTHALRDLQTLHAEGFATSQPAEELEIRLVYASFGRGLPPVFLADSWVRTEAKHLLRLLEAHSHMVPEDLARLTCVFLRTKLTLRFQDADRLASIEANLPGASS